MKKEQLLSRMEDSLVAEIPIAAANTFFMEPLYAILIDYFQWGVSPPTFELDTSPPLIVAAPVTVRNTIQSGHEYPDCVQWDAGYVIEIEGSIPLQLPGDGAAAAWCREFFSTFDEDNEQQGPMLQRVAARLNAVNWHSITGVTDDFIVCLQDSAGQHDNQKDIDACVPPDRISLLRSRNHLGNW